MPQAVLRAELSMPGNDQRIAGIGGRGRTVFPAVHAQRCQQRVPKKHPRLQEDNDDEDDHHGDHDAA